MPAGDGNCRAGRLDRGRSPGSATTSVGCALSIGWSIRRTGLIWLPGDAAQCDLWLPPKKIPLEDGTRTLFPVLVITAAHSRFVLGRMIATRTTADLLPGMWALLQLLGRTPAADDYVISTGAPRRGTSGVA